MKQTTHFFLAFLFASQILVAQDVVVESFPLHKRSPGMKVLVVSHITPEMNAIVNQLKARKIPFETAEWFDLERTDYSDVFAIFAATDSSGAMKKKDPALFSNLEKFIRDGGHMLMLGAYNGAYLECLHPLGVKTSYFHCPSMKRIPGRTEVLFHGHAPDIPNELKVRSEGSITVSVPHIDFLLREKKYLDGKTAFSTLQVGRGRFSITMARLGRQEKAFWMYAPLVDWVINGGPTTVDQLKERVVLDPLSLQQYLNGPQVAIAPVAYAKLKKELQPIWEDQQDPSKLLEIAEAENVQQKKFVLLRQAAEQFALRGDPNATVSTLLLAGNMFRFDVLATQARLLEVCISNTSEKGNINQVAKLAFDAYEDANSSYQYDVAYQLLQVAETAAVLGDNPHFKELAKSYKLRLRPVYESWLRVEDSFTTWKDHPEDPDLNTTIGKFLSFVANDWSVGLACLSEGKDHDLQELARLTLNPSDSALTRIRVADRWSTYSKNLEGIERANLERRIQYWYRQVQDDLNELSGIDRHRVEKVLDQKIGTESANLDIRIAVDGRGILTITPDRMSWETQAGRETFEVQVNKQSWNPVEGELLNRGSTRFMPDRIEFLSASLKVRKQAGVIKLQEVSKESVVVRISDIPRGSNTYEFNLQFGNEK